MITTAGGAKWLVDCGRQAPDQVEAAGLSWHELEGQIVTHVHGDHIYGMEDFAFRRLVESLDQDLLILHSRDDPDVPIEAGRSVAAHWAGSRLVELDGLGHRRILKNPSVVSAAVAFAADRPDRA